MRKFVLIGVVLSIAGCVQEKTIDQMTPDERRELAQQFIETCHAKGFHEDRDEAEMIQCFNEEVDRETDRREAAAENAAMFGMAVSQGLTSYGNSMSQSANSYRRPVNCTSNRIGNQTYTNCY